MSKSDAAALGLLYAEAEVWSAATGNGLFGLMLDEGFMDCMEAPLDRLATARVDPAVKLAALALATDFEARRTRVSSFLMWTVVSLRKDPSEYHKTPRFQVDENTFDTLIEAVEFVVGRAPDGRTLVGRGHFFVNAVMPRAGTPEYAELIAPPPVSEGGQPSLPDEVPVKVDYTAVRNPHAVTFKGLMPGDTFLYRGVLHVTAGAVVQSGKICESNGVLQLFGVDVAAGTVLALPADTEVVRVAAEVAVKPFA